MTPERWQRVESILAEALDVDPAGRAAFLDQACIQDSALRQEVESLLSFEAQAEGVVERAIENATAQFETLSLAEGDRAGVYRVIREIGRGGMGTVYLAERDDDQFHKQVAIKLVSLGMDTAAVLQRFRNERQILARLDHPFIARLLDGGSTDAGRPYLVMEFVQGKPITAYCAEHDLSVQERIELFQQVCAAVQSAHQNLIVHRDLKPHNILVDVNGSPKLLDFGIAKLLDPDDDPQLTILAGGQQMLTPEYASPEQVRGEAISTVADVYSLGAVLYELVTGSAPHRITSRDPASLVRAICESDIVAPSAAARSAGKTLPANDLDNILLTALRKDRHERYASVQDFSDDLQRYLDNRPVHARRQTLGYRAFKFLRRNRISVAATVLAAASLVVGAAISTYQAHRAERRFEQVRKLAHAFLFDLPDQIENLPGATQARESMVRTALEYLNSLAGDSKSDPSLTWELASAYQRIGDLQGYGVRSNLGQHDAAIESQRRALELATQLAARGFDPKVQRLLAIVHHRLGHLTATGDSRAALEQYRQALALLEPLYQANPGNPEDSALLSTIYGHKGEADYTLGHTAAAAESWQRTLDIAETWNRRNPSDDSRFAIALGHRRLSIVSQNQGDLMLALRHGGEAVRIHEALAASQPSNTVWNRELMNSYERLARIWARPESLTLENPGTALAYNRKVLAIARSLVAADPRNSMALTDLIIAETNICLTMPQNEPSNIATECRSALNLADEGSASFVLHFVHIAPPLAAALQRLGRQAEARDLAFRGLDAATKRVGRFPARVDLKLQLLRMHVATGDLLVAMQERGGALQQYQQALSIAEELLPSRPTDLILRRDLADCYESLARYYEKPDRAQARKWYQKSLDVWTAWPRLAVSTALDQKRRERLSRALKIISSS